MTTSASAETATAPAPRTPIWEDFVDIFTSPASVFRRRRDGKFGIALLVYLAIMAALTFASVRTLGPAQAADGRRAMERMAANNPQMREAMQQSAAAASRPNPILGTVSAVLIFAISVFVAGIFTWLIGKLFGATATIAVALMIVTYAQFPRILQYLAVVLQGLFMDPAGLDSMFRVSTSAARFMDPNTDSLTLMTVLSRVDPFLLWATALIAVGMHVVGGLSKLEAAAVAVLIWVLGTLPILLPTLLF